MATAILEHLTALSDPTRCRMLLVLERHELTVTELCAVLQLPQSTVSRHLKNLVDDAWVASRREATSRLYSMPPGELEVPARRLWLLVREQVSSSPAADQDERRLKAVLDRRRSKSEVFFSSAAGQWDHVRSELFGPVFHLQAFPALLDSEWTVGDLGCGVGQVSEALAPHVKQVIAIDGSAAMLQAAKKRLSGFKNVDLRRGDLEALPIDDGRLHAALLFLVLHHLSNPAKALREAARVLRPGGRLVVVDMLPHDHEEYRLQMGHVWLGFSEKQVARYADEAGLSKVKFHELASAPHAKGPALFVASAIKNK